MIGRLPHWKALRVMFGGLAVFWIAVLVILWLLFR